MSTKGSRAIWPFPGLDWVGGLLCLGLVFGGYALEWLTGMAPCPFCLLERYLLAGLGAIFLVSALHRPTVWGRRAYGVALLIPTGGGLAATIYHLRIQSGTASSSCATTSPAEPSSTHLRIPELEPATGWEAWLPNAPGACTEIDTFLGASLVVWALAGFVALGLTGSAIHLWGTPRAREYDRLHR